MRRAAAGGLVIVLCEGCTTEVVLPTSAPAQVDEVDDVNVDDVNEVGQAEPSDERSDAGGRAMPDAGAAHRAQDEDGETSGQRTAEPPRPAVEIAPPRPASTGPGGEIAGIRQATYQTGALPGPTTAGTTTIVAIAAPPAVTNGGSVTLLIELSAPVALPSFVVAVPGAPGHYTVPGVDTNGDGIYEVKIDLADATEQPTLSVLVALATEDGELTEYQRVDMVVLQSGVGDVKITLSFDRTHDLDLHVFEPGGEEIDFTNPASANGGQLDLDSGSNCVARANSENVFWPPGAAPSGPYRVVVNNFEQCSPGSIDFTVRVVYGATVETYAGQFADGTAGTSVEVATFTR